MSKLRLGIIGVGNFAIKRHIPEIIDHNKFELVAICRRNRETLKKINHKLKIKSTYTNYKNMLENEKLDAVLISSPHSLHSEHALESLKKNCHVLLEKPIGTSILKTKEIIKLANKKKLRLICIHNPPYENHFRVIKKIIDQNIIGKVEYANIVWSDYKSPFFGKGKFIKSQLSSIMPTKFRNNKKIAGGGILFDSGCHLLAEIIWILNKKPLNVYCSIDNKKIELRVNISLEFTNNQIINLNIIGDSKHKNRRIESCYWGDKNIIRLTGKPYKIEIDNKEISNYKKFIGNNNIYPIKEFYTLIKNPFKKPLFSNIQSLWVICIISAAYESFSRNKKIKIKY